MADDKDMNGTEDNLDSAISGIGDMIAKALFEVKEAVNTIDKELDNLDEEMKAADAEIEEADEEIEEGESSSLLKIGEFTLENLDGYLESGVSFLAAANGEIAQETYNDVCVVFTKDVTEIEENWFSNDVFLYAAYFLADEVKIGDNAFTNCENLETVWFKGSAIIGENVFTGCKSLENVTAGGRIEGMNADTFSGSPWAKSLEDDDFVIAEDTLLKYNGKEKHAEVPEGVRAISKRAFENAQIESIKLPDTLEEIGEGAFDGAFLEEIIIPEGVKKIPENAFAFCRYLQKAHIPESVTVIEEGAFHDCESLKEITISGMNTEIDPEAFTSCDKFFIKAHEGSRAEEFVLEYGGELGIAMKVIG